MYGDHGIDQLNKVSPGCAQNANINGGEDFDASQNVTWEMEKILMHSTDSEEFQCRPHHEHAGIMRTC